MLCNYTQMKMAHLSRTSPSMSSMGKVCDMLGKTFRTSLVGNHRATGGLCVNSSSVKGVVIIFPLFLLEGNATLLMTPKANWWGYTQRSLCKKVLPCQINSCSQLNGDFKYCSWLALKLSGVRSKFKTKLYFIFLLNL